MAKPKPLAAQLVDADDLAVDVDQRAAGVAGQDQRVVLDPAREEARGLPFADVELLDLAAGEVGEDARRVGDDPLVIDDESASGLPIANTVSPTRSASESPNSACGKVVAVARAGELQHREVGERVVGDHRRPRPRGRR